MVRLQRCYAVKFHCIAILSIPLWCDCNGHTDMLDTSHKLAFNPTMVRLQRVWVQGRKVGRGIFNPTMVRLQPAALHELWGLYELIFQSHYGAIATAATTHTFAATWAFSIPLWCDCNNWKDRDEYAVMSNFNPTMVRLQHYMVRSEAGCWYISIPLWCDCNVEVTLQLSDSIVFQSHYGAIATELSECACSLACMISIPLWCDCNCMPKA